MRSDMVLGAVQSTESSPSLQGQEDPMIVRFQQQGSVELIVKPLQIAAVQPARQIIAA